MAPLMTQMQSLNENLAMGATTTLPLTLQGIHFTVDCFGTEVSSHRLIPSPEGYTLLYDNYDSCYYHKEIH